MTKKEAKTALSCMLCTVNDANLHEEVGSCYAVGQEILDGAGDADYDYKKLKKTYNADDCKSDSTVFVAVTINKLRN